MHGSDDRVEQDGDVGRMGISIVDAVRLSRENGAAYERIRERRAALSARVDAERAAQEGCRRDVYDTALVPFRDTFARLKNVELAELAGVVLPDVADVPDVDGEPVRGRALAGLAAAAGGMTAGVGAGTATIAGVSAFAAASTGTPIASLSGAAATNATLAWLGGGSLAAGGGGVAAGTLVLTGVVGLPILLAGGGYVLWEGRRSLRRQHAAATSLTAMGADVDDEERRWDAVLDRYRAVRETLVGLRDAVTARLPRFVELVDRNDDHTTYGLADRALVADLVQLVTTTVAVMATEVTAGTGPCADVLDDAGALLARVAGCGRTEHAA